MNTVIGFEFGESFPFFSSSNLHQGLVCMYEITGTRKQLPSSPALEVRDNLMPVQVD